jgi:peptide chain release factor subunit 3
VIAARRGEFETGFERGGQTREHAQLAKTLGVSKLLVVVNKMDDPSVQWSKERFDEIERKTVPFLKSCGYNVKRDVQFLPISGLLGLNMKEHVPTTVCDWWDGCCLFEALDAIELPERNPNGPFRYLCFFFFGMYCWIVFVQFFPLGMILLSLSIWLFFLFFVCSVCTFS